MFSKVHGLKSMLLSWLPISFELEEELSELWKLPKIGCHHLITGYSCYRRAGHGNLVQKRPESLGYVFVGG